MEQLDALSKDQRRTVKALHKYGYPIAACIDVLSSQGWDLKTAAEQIVAKYGGPSAAATEPPARLVAHDTSVSASYKILDTPEQRTLALNAALPATAKRPETERFEGDNDTDEGISVRTSDDEPKSTQKLDDAGRVGATLKAQACKAPSESEVNVKRPKRSASGAVQRQIFNEENITMEEEDGAQTSRSTASRQGSARPAELGAPAESAAIDAIRQLSHRARDLARAAAAESADADSSSLPASALAVDATRLRTAALAVIDAALLVGAKGRPSGTGNVEDDGLEDDIDVEVAGSCAAEHAMTFTSALPVLRRLSMLLGVCAGPVQQPGLPIHRSPDAVACLTSLAVDSACQLRDALHAFVKHGVAIKGLLPVKVDRKGVVLAPGAKARATALACALEAACALLMIMAVPGVDRRLVSEDCVTDVLHLASAHLSAHVVPCFDPLDPVWMQSAEAVADAMDVDDGPRAGTGAGSGKGEPLVSARGRKRKSKGGVQELDMEDFEGDAEVLDEGEGDTKRGRRSDAGAAVKVTTAMLRSAQESLRPVILGLSHVMERLGELSRVIPLGEALVSELARVALMAATQTNAESGAVSGPGRSGHSSASSSSAGSAGDAAKGALAVSAISVIQTLFELDSMQRVPIINTLCNKYIEAASSKRFTRGFTIIPSVPRVVGRKENGVHGDASVNAMEGSSGGVNVHACTAIVLHLVQAAAVLPTTAECNAADGVMSTSPNPVDEDDGKDKSKGKGKPKSKVKSTPELEPKSKGKKGKQPVESDIEMLYDTQVVEEKTSKGKKGRKAAHAAAEPAAKPAGGARGKGKAAGAEVGMASKLKGKGKAKGDVEDEVEDAQSAAAAAPAPCTSFPGQTPSPSAGFAACEILAKRYVGMLFSWSEGKLKNEGDIRTADDENPKAVMRLLVEDLLSLVDVPEWPAASMFLGLVVKGLRTLVVAALPKPAGAAGVVPQKADASADKVAVYAAGLLGAALPRLLLCRSFAAQNGITLPADAPAPTIIGAGAEPGASALCSENIACHCGLGLLSGRLHIDCDGCGRWFHGLCLGFVDGFTPASWQCDPCVLRAQVREQTAAAAGFASRRATSQDGGRPFQPASAAAQSVLTTLSSARAAVVVQRVHAVAASSAPSSHKDAAGAASLCDTRTVLEQLALNFLASRSHEDVFSRMARRFLISKWASAALQSRNWLQREFYMAAWELPTPSMIRKSQKLSMYNAARLSVQMLAEEPLLATLNSSLNLLVSCFAVDSSKMRAAVVKTMTDLIAVQPALLTSNPGVLRAVAAMLKDSSKMVRSAALDLIGEHITAQPGALLPGYASMLLDKLSDDGVGTRKKAVGILRDLLLMRRQLEPPSLDASGGSGEGAGAGPAEADLTRPVLLPRHGGHTCEVLKALLARACNRHEEDSVKDAITATFDALWFGALGRGGGEGGLRP